MSDLTIGNDKFCNKKTKSLSLELFCSGGMFIIKKDKGKGKAEEITFRWEKLRNVFREGCDI